MTDTPPDPDPTLTIDDLVDEDGAPLPPIDLDDPATWPEEPQP